MRFTARSATPLASEEEYASVEFYVQLLDTVSRTTYASIYVIDYFRENLLYVSDNPLLLCGISAHDVQKMSHDFYLEYVPEYEIPLLLEINR